MLTDDVLRFSQSDAPAYRCAEGVLSFRELCARACRLAHRLAAQTAPGEPIAVCGHKQLLMPICLLACAIADRPYLPVDSSIPSARARQMLALAGVGLVLSPGDAVFAGCETLDSQTLRCLCEDRHAPLLLPVPAAPEDLLYILFTSGSTGDPKGVRVTRRNVEFFLDWLRGLLDTAAGPVLNLASFSFDLSVADLWLSLTCGRCECALEQPLLSDYPALFARISDVAPALAVMTPSFAEVLLADPSFHAARFPTLCELLFCGEPLRPSTVLRLCERFPDLRIVNSYGPTECTVAACGCEISRELAREGALPIGVSGPDSPIVLLNAENRPCADCEVGELVITGERVAAGYLGSERGGFCSFDGRPAYRTGDLGFRRGERLYYSGRVDRQLKIHGFRIEPGDIEQNLCRLARVAQVAVLVIRDADKTPRRLIAFVVPIADRPAPDPADLRRELSLLLPPQMLPTIRLIDRLPLTANGKCDYAALQQQKERPNG